MSQKLIREMTLEDSVLRDMPPPVAILEVPVHPLTVSQLHTKIQNVIEQRRKAMFLHVNLHALNLAYENRWLLEFFQSAECVFCDGAGVRLAALLYGTHLPPRITYADWAWQLAEFTEQKGFSIYFLGAKPGIAAKAAAHLQQHFPALNVVGINHGYFDKSAGSAENLAVIQQINACKPNILVIAFGMPLQERWLMENAHHINANVILTGGAVFDFISGELRRGPRWMTNYGFEWLARLLIEPRRLWRRYLVGTPLFFWRVFRQHF